KPWAGCAGAAVAVGLGLAVTAVWIGLDGRYPAIPWIGGTRSAFDPLVLPPVAQFPFLVLRMAGLVVVVPLIEELFYRSFLMRWVVDPDISRVPIARVTPLGLGVTSSGF